MDRAFLRRFLFGVVLPEVTTRGCERPARIRGRFVSVLIIAALFAVGGCAAARAPHASETVRASLGRIGVLAGPASASGEWNMPAKGGTDGARRGAAEAIMVALRSGFGGFLLAPVLVPAGSIVGAATAEPAEVVEEAEATIQAAFAALQIPVTLRDRVVHVARAETRYTVVPHQSATGADAAGEHPDRADGAIATTLEVSVQEYGTKMMPGSSNRRPLDLFLTVQVRLLRAADGSVLHTQQVAWVSEGRPLSAWAVAQGEPVRQELARGIEYLAERIVDVIFLVTSLP